ncbi:putative transcription factor interactor and regulator CCHC(Zn) family [Helianthus anomalus]
MVTCFNYRENGHFKRECTKPPQQGNQYPFNRNQVVNNERTMVPANSANRALIVQVDESCDWYAQLGNGGGGGIAYYAEVVKNASDGESSGNDDSSGYNDSSIEEGSSSGEDRSETELREDVDAEEAALEQKIEGTFDDFSKHLSEVGSSTFRAAFMARLDCQSCQVSLNKPILSKCVECMVLKGKYLELEGKFDHTKKHHQNLIVALTKCIEANTTLKKNEKEFKTTIETLRKDYTELKKTILNKKIGINNYINIIDETKKELAHARCEHDAIKLKLDSYSNSRYVLDHIINVQKKKGDLKCIGYQTCPLPVRHIYTKMPDDEDMPHFEPTVPLDLAEFTASLGFTKGASSSQS